MVKADGGAGAVVAYPLNDIDFPVPMNDWGSGRVCLATDTRVLRFVSLIE